MKERPLIRRYLLGLVALLFAFLLWLSNTSAPVEPTPVSAPVAYAAETEPSTPSPPFFFIENRGQAPDAVRFHAEAAGHTVLLQRDAVILRRSSLSDSQGAEITMHFVDASPVPTLEGIAPQRGRVHFYRGDAPNWQTDLPTFGGVRYRDLYPGIDLEYQGANGTFKSAFLVAPGSDPDQIRLRYTGTDAPSLRADGALVLATSLGELVEAAPVVYQDMEGTRVFVDARYDLHSDGTVGYALGAYDATHPLVVDPEITFEATVGGSGPDLAHGITIAPDGTFIVTGETLSNDFPTVNAFDDALAANGADIFVFRLDPETGDLIYATFLGGATPVPNADDARDVATDVAVDADGNAYIIGQTGTSDFPTLNPIQAANAGGQDIIFAQFAPDGTLLFSTYLGGAGTDRSGALALDGTSIWATGTTNTLEGNFPTLNPLQGPGGFDDAFVVWLEPTDTAYDLGFSTFLGGENFDSGDGIGVDAAGDVYIGGQSNSGNFPIVNAIQPTLGGGSDGFIAKLASDASALLYATFLGGSGFEGVVDLDVDADGTTAVTGTTPSPDFPTEAAAQATLQGTQDAFVALFDATGALLFSSYWGGSSLDFGRGVAVKDGDVLLAGVTFSEDFPLIDPLADAPESPNGFLTVFDDQREVQTSTTVSGTIDSVVDDLIASEAHIATEKLGNAGITSVSYGPDIVPNALDVTKIVDEGDYEVGDTVSFTITVTNSGVFDALDVRLTDTFEANLISFDHTDEDCFSDNIVVDGMGKLFCEIGTVAAGSSHTFRTRFRITRLRNITSLVGGNVVNNSVIVSSTNMDPVMATETFFCRPHTGDVLFISIVMVRANKQAEDVDIYMDSTQVVNDLPPNTSTGRVTVDLAQVVPRINLTESTAPNFDTPLETFAPDFLVGEGADAYVPDASALLFVEVAPDSIDLLVKHDVRATAQHPDQVDVFLAHAAYDAPALNLRLADGTVLFDDVEPRSLTDYASLTPGIHDLALSHTDGTLFDVFRLDLSAHQGQALTLAVVPVVPEGGKQTSVALLAFDDAGTTLDTPVVTSSEATAPPLHFTLGDNYPNPFRQTTTLRFTLPEPAQVDIEVFDLLGRLVVSETAGSRAPGFQAYTLDASALPAGVYLYRILATQAARRYTQTSRFVVLR